MPYNANGELPEKVKGALPEAAQTVWRKAFNSALDQYGDEGQAAAVAWTAVRNAGYTKGEDGKWVKKRLSEGSFTVFAKSEKFDDERHIVFGWGSVTKKDGNELVDLQGDIIPDSELEGAVYDFMIESQTHDEMHERIVTDSRIVESVVVTDEKLAKMFPGLDPTTIPGNRGWWIGIQINDEEIYTKHKNGTYTGFSITGTCVREEVDYADESY